MIFVIATIEVFEGKRDEFLAEFHKLVPLVHAEQGCVEYGPTVDMETSMEIVIGPRTNVTTIVEKWESLEDLERHLIAPHMIAYRESVKDIVNGMTLQILEPA